MNKRMGAFLGTVAAFAAAAGLGQGVWATPKESSRTPAEVIALADLSPEEQALLEFLQKEGAALLVMAIGKKYDWGQPTPPGTGVIEIPKDDKKDDKPKDDKPKDNTGGGPFDPEDPDIDPPFDPPPEHSPEPGTLILGLVGLGATSLAYLRRRKKADGLAV